jgi:hypothetical protein
MWTWPLASLKPDIKKVYMIQKHCRTDLRTWDLVPDPGLIIRDAPDTVFAGYPAGRISG